MKEFLKLIGLVGALALVLTVRAWAAPAVPTLPAQADPYNAQNQIAPTVPDQTGQNSGAWGGQMSGRMGGGHMGRGMMTSGEGNGGSYGTSMGEMTPMHDDIALQLGMTTQDLYNHMATGRSLMQIAGEKGITEQQLMDGILANRQNAYGQAVMAGHMTQEQVDSYLQDLNNNLQHLLNDQGVESHGWGMMWGTESGEATMYRMHH